MQIVVYAEDQAHAWESLLTEGAHTVTPLLWGQHAPAADVAVVVLAEPWPARVWLRTLEVPLILVTEAVELARPLCAVLPLLRVVCHPQRAIQTLPELLIKTRAIYAGTLVLGPLIGPLEWATPRR